MRVLEAAMGVYLRVGSIGRMRALWVGILLGALCVASRAEERAVKQRVAPVYPEVAKRLRVTGVVKLEVTVSAEGKVMEVKTLSGNHMLSTAAEEAVSKWRFAAASANSTEDLDINFELNQ
jgi:TonB family protein